MNRQIAQEELENNWSDYRDFTMYKFAQILINEIEELENQIEKLEQEKELMREREQED